MAITTEIHSASVETRTKKDQIVHRFVGGEHDLHEIAKATDSALSYVASVLQSAGLIEGYYDLYNDSKDPMNAYAGLFRRRLGFKDEATALNSVRLLHEAYLGFEREKDRAGQHHALMMAMVMFNRARWSGKTREADIFKRWLVRAMEH